MEKLIKGNLPKKLSTICIWKIIKENTDYDRHITQKKIGEILYNEYGISL